VKVYFIGGGPGDPRLITLKAKEIIEMADTVIYTGSLVNPEILQYAREGAKIYNSASMTLQEIVDVMAAATSRGETVARIHTGDPSIYGALQEQIDALRERDIPFEIVPGVSSFTAAAAALQREYTLPGVSQTVIITRIEGRTKVPPPESLEGLARHRASMCIFLSVHMIDDVADKLLKSYPPNTPAAVVEKASWPEERIIRGTLGELSSKVKEAGIKKTSLIVVGNFLSGPYERSKLYSKKFAHGFRQDGIV